MHACVDRSNVKRLLVVLVVVVVVSVGLPAIRIFLEEFSSLVITLHVADLSGVTQA
jgi:hypothetical protein